MFLDLLIKDAKRTRRNPWPILIFLAIPLSLTGLIGAAFSPRSQSSGLGQIKLAVVDDDRSVHDRGARGGREDRVEAAGGPPARDRDGTRDACGAGAVRSGAGRRAGLGGQPLGHD